MKARILSLTAALGLALAGSARAQVAAGVNFQGRLTDSLGNLVTGTKSITFSIWNAAASGSQLWTETQNVAVSSGIYNVALGGVVALSTGVFASSGTWLQIQVSPDAAMTPRLPFQSVPYAFSAGVAASVAPSGSVDLANPDGLANLTPVMQRISLTSPYTVPAGMNFHLVNVGSGTAACSTYAMCDLTATGGSSLLHFGGFWNRYASDILGPGTVLASTSSAITFDIIGFTVPAAVATIVADIAPGGSYTVPAGVNLYLLSIGERIIPNSPIFSSSAGLTVGGINLGFDSDTPWIIGAGQTISNPASNVITFTINGYLK